MWLWCLSWVSRAEQPIDVAIEEMTKKVEKLKDTVMTKSTDMTLLQMQLQGSLSTQVQPTDMYMAYIRSGQRWPNGVRICFSVQARGLS